MLNIPYVGNPGTACALAGYTMVAKYFFPQVSFDDIAKISDWHPDYVIWAFKFWLWIMDKEVHITDYDLIDYDAWANEGVEGLKKSVSKKEFEFFEKSTKDLTSYTEDIAKVLAHKNFTHIPKKPIFSDLESAFRSGAVCTAVLNAKTLDKLQGFSLHAVVVLDITDNEVVFHDPRKKSRPSRRESRELFEKAWLSAVDEPELTVYKKY